MKGKKKGKLPTKETYLLLLVCMHELYQNIDYNSTELYHKPKIFFKYFPKEVFGSEFKNDYYHIKERLYALKEFKWVQYNSDDRLRVISVDIDNSHDSMMYQDFNLPKPTWIIQTDKGFQYHWALKQDIPLKTVNSNKSIKLVKDILNKLVALLDGDFNAIGINRVFRNPVTNRSWFTGNEVELKEFYDLQTPKEDYFNKLLGRVEKQKNLFGATYGATYDFSSMKEGDGRNCALFDVLRYWAYDEAKQGSYDKFALQRKAEYLNSTFAEPQKEKAVLATVEEIDWFIENKFNKGYYMSLSAEDRKKVASANGKKSGEKRSVQAKIKILAELNIMESFEMKITSISLSERSGTNKRTVLKYLQELGYKEVSRKEGWKKK